MGDDHPHFIVSFRRPVSQNRAQPSAGAPDEANLQKHRLTSGHTMKEHYTNVWRILCLAESHPMIEHVEKQNLGKMASEAAIYDAEGRSQKAHQSPFDAKCTLASSGAQFRVGYTVNAMTPALAGVWYSAMGKHSATKGGMIESVFGDLTEGVHLEPDALKGKLKRCTSQLNSGSLQILSALTRIQNIMLFVFLGQK